MIHLVFNRPDAILKVYDSLGQLYAEYTAQGDAWGNHDGDGGPPPYGTNCWCPPGHYRLDSPQFFDPPIISEGYGQIPVQDVDVDTLSELVSSGRATANGSSADIGGVDLPISQLAKYGRSAIMIHGGGSNAPHPLDDQQQLCRTEGCTRLFNGEWKVLAHWLDPQYNGNHVIFSVLGDPQTLAC